MKLCRMDENLRRELLEKDEEGLEGEVRVARTDGTVVKQPLNIVHKDAGLAGPGLKYSNVTNDELRRKYPTPTVYCR
jgi:hypothetical protein